MNVSDMTPEGQEIYHDLVDSMERSRNGRVSAYTVVDPAFTPPITVEYRHDAELIGLALAHYAATAPAMFNSDRLRIAELITLVRMQSVIQSVSNGH